MQSASLHVLQKFVSISSGVLQCWTTPANYHQQSAKISFLYSFKTSTISSDVADDPLKIMMGYAWTVIVGGL